MTHSGGKPHTNVGDRGQPYEVTFDDGDGNRKVFGWAETTNAVAQLMRSIELHPAWHSPQWRDRRTGETGPAESRVSDVYLSSSLQEISRGKALDSQMISTAFLRMLLTEIIERRAADQQTSVTDARIDELLRTLAIESSLPELTAMNRDAVRAWLGTGPRAVDKSAALLAYIQAMQAAGAPHEPLEVYTSNSWRRVGLKREYKQVMGPCRDKDGHLNIDGTNVLHALVAAFNAMLESQNVTDEIAQRLGFADGAEFHRLVAAVDLSDARKLAAFKRWQDEDGTKDGLVRLMQGAQS